jgi:hypothetical protein
MKGLEPLLEQALKIRIGLLHVFPHYYGPCGYSSQQLEKSRMSSSQRNVRSLRASLVAETAVSPGKNAEQSFGLQAELNRRGRNLARCCRVVLEDLKRLAERCCRYLSLTKHNSRAHKANPALDISRRTL